MQSLNMFNPPPPNRTRIILTSLMLGLMIKLLDKLLFMRASSSIPALWYLPNNENFYLSSLMASAGILALYTGGPPVWIGFFLVAIYPLFIGFILLAAPNYAKTVGFAQFYWVLFFCYVSAAAWLGRLLFRFRVKLQGLKDPWDPSFPIPWRKAFLIGIVSYAAGIFIVMVDHSFHLKADPSARSALWADAAYRSLTPGCAMVFALIAGAIGFWAGARPWLFAVCLVSVFPTAVLLDLIRDRTSHNLLPFELVAWFRVGVPSFIGASAGVGAKRFRSNKRTLETTLLDGISNAPHEAFRRR
jgi:hypothetical protein